jgi:hypothetical protein
MHMATLDGRTPESLPDGMPDLSTGDRVRDNAALLWLRCLERAQEAESSAKEKDGKPGYLWEGSARAAARDLWDAFDGLLDNTPSHEAYLVMLSYLRRSGNLLRLQRSPEMWWVPEEWDDSPPVPEDPDEDAQARELRGRSQCQYPGCDIPDGMTGGGLTAQGLKAHLTRKHGITMRSYGRMTAGLQAWPGEAAEQLAAELAAERVPVSTPAPEPAIAVPEDGQHIMQMISAIIAERDQLRAELAQLKAGGFTDDEKLTEIRVLQDEKAALRAELAAVKHRLHQVEIIRRLPRTV